MLHTKRGQFFFQADWPGMYLPLRLRNPVFLDIVLPEEGTRPEDITSAIQQLERKASRVRALGGEIGCCG
jgi:hypothetical protein